MVDPLFIVTSGASLVAVHFIFKQRNKHIKLVALTGLIILTLFWYKMFIALYAKSQFVHYINVEEMKTVCGYVFLMVTGAVVAVNYKPLALLGYAVMLLCAVLLAQVISHLI